MLQSPRQTKRGPKLALGLALTMAASCVSPIQIPATETRIACEAFALIKYSRLHDTEETIVQVREHNAAYKALCP